MFSNNLFLSYFLAFCMSTNLQQLSHASWVLRGKTPITGVPRHHEALQDLVDLVAKGDKGHGSQVMKTLKWVQGSYDEVGGNYFLLPWNNNPIMVDWDSGSSCFYWELSFSKSSDIVGWYRDSTVMERDKASFTINPWFSLVGDGWLCWGGEDTLNSHDQGWKKINSTWMTNSTNP